MSSNIRLVPRAFTYNELFEARFAIRNQLRSLREYVDKYSQYISENDWHYRAIDALESVEVALNTENCEMTFLESE